jgi:hypothetical protein
MNIQKVKISEVIPNKENPRLIKKDKLKKLVNSIKEFPAMLEIRPIVVDEENVILGGNMRYEACKRAGLEEIYIIKASELTEEQKKEFVVKDNVGFGDWDWDVLANHWDLEQLGNWGLDSIYTDDDLEEMKNPINRGSDYPFATRLDIENNYVVLKFDNDIDWIYVKGLLELENTWSRRANGERWTIGIGHVIDGLEAIEKIKKNG